MATPITPSSGTSASPNIIATLPRRSSPKRLNIPGREPIFIICLIQSRIAAFDPGSVGGRSLRITEIDLWKSCLSAHFDAKDSAVTSLCVYRGRNTTIESINGIVLENRIILDREQVIVIFSGFCKAQFHGMMAST
ncbi:hypothetical protein [uncultured Bosea sp.]|uniref:hypothetical protein n=1 Tax=uncultured Bosea sp. TaxID=211457 RepID=UPI0025D8B51C|nr:hypothetical protein [uncultured Bosea sp.]